MYDVKKLLTLLLVLLVAVGGAFASGTPDSGSSTESSTSMTSTKSGPAVPYEARSILDGSVENVMISGFGESPLLAAMVASGELPPVEERLPTDPLVLIPIERIGTYGGTEISARTSNLLNTLTKRLEHEYLLTYTSPYLDVIYPNVAKDFVKNADLSEFIFYLREGMKWSDGENFTADDIMFWYEDIIMNDDLYPSKPGAMKVNDEVGIVTKIDDYTVKFTFAGTNAVFEQEMARWRPEPYAPRHFLEQFHPTYTSDADIKKAMADGGFDVWADFFRTKWNLYGNPDCPNISAWHSINDQDEQIHILERNPYYWKVDSEGNQLPYIDRSEHPIVQDREAWFLMAMGGDLTHAMGGLTGGRPNYPMYMQNRERGDYRVSNYVWLPNTYNSVFLNYTHEDPAKKELLNNRDFREALSVAMNRDEVNDIIYDGDAFPSNISPTNGPPYRGEDPLFKEKYIQYDPARANELLDKIGLTNKDNDGFRTNKDGSKLVFTILAGSWAPDDPEVADMYRQYWANVGLNMVVKAQSPQLVGQAMSAGQYDLIVRPTAAGSPPANIFTRGVLFPIHGSWMINYDWGAWASTGGAEGVEPPEGVKRLRKLYEMGMVEADRAKQIELVREAFEIMIDNLWVIGGLNQPETSKYRIFTNALRNVHVPGEPHATELYAGQPSQWFFEK